MAHVPVNFTEAAAGDIPITPNIPQTNTLQDTLAPGEGQDPKVSIPGDVDEVEV